MSKSAGAVVPVERIAHAIYLIRGEKVMLDDDLARLYGVKTKVLNQSVRRHEGRFPADFMFRLTREEFDDLRSQIVTSNRGGRRYPPLGGALDGSRRQVAAAARLEDAIDPQSRLSRP